MRHARPELSCVAAFVMTVWSQPALVYYISVLFLSPRTCKSISEFTNAHMVTISTMHTYALESTHAYKCMNTFILDCYYSTKALLWIKHVMNLIMIMILLICLFFSLLFSDGIAKGSRVQNAKTQSTRIQNASCSDFVSPFEHLQILVSLSSTKSLRIYILLYLCSFTVINYLQHLFVFLGFLWLCMGICTVGVAKLQKNTLRVNIMQKFPSLISARHDNIWRKIHSRSLVIS